jgi:hypothetical protein
VDCFVVGGHASLLEGLTKSGMSMTCSSNILRTRAILHCKYTFSEHFASVGANNVHTENLISVSIDENFNEALAVLVSPCSAVCHEWEDSLSVFNASLL